jgi:hypothetical protein
MADDERERKLRVVVVGPGSGFLKRSECAQAVRDAFNIDIPVIPEPTDDLDGGVKLLERVLGDPFPADVLVASSRGGAYAAELIARKLWSGATMLLSCSSTSRCVTMDVGGNVTAAGVPVFMVHAALDGIYPIDPVRQECSGFKTAQLVEVNDTHGLTSLTGERLCELIRQAHAWAQADFSDDVEFDEGARDAVIRKIQMQSQLKNMAGIFAGRMKKNEGSADDEETEEEEWAEQNV